MSQFENPYAGGMEAPAGETKMSGMAVMGLICSLVFCCPVVSILGPLLGAGAMVRIGGNPALRGRGVAIAAIVIGIATTGLGGAGYYKLYDVVAKMQAAIEEVPDQAFTAGASGDYAAFHDGMYPGPGVVFGDDEAAAFFTEFERRYGAPTSVALNATQQASPSPMGTPSIPLNYTIYTESGQSVPAVITIVIADEVTGELWINRMGEIRISDSDNGDLIYPPTGTSAPADASTGAATDIGSDTDSTEADGDQEGE